MSPLNSIAQFPCTRGIVASNQPLAQPKGSVQRGSNLILSARGALTTCDGSQLVHALASGVASNRGKFMAAYLFAPIGVTSYYLALAKALGQPLGQPRNLAASDGGTGGTLAAGTYFYVVTAIDNAVGETTASNEASQAVAANHKINLTWNTLPNAPAYNIYRGTASRLEGLIATGVTTNSFTDTGLAPTPTNFALAGAVATQISGNLGLFTFNAALGVTFPKQVPFFTVSGNGTSLFNQTYLNVTLISPTVIQVTQITNIFAAGSGGTLSVPVTPPLVDTTQQTALYRMPQILGNPAQLPFAYSDANIVALFPADIRPTSLPGGGGGGGSGGGGGTGGGGGGSGGSTPSGGVPGNVSFIPQIVQFTNQAVLALGNGFTPQIFSDPTGTPVNPALTGAISSISVDAFGIVTVNTTSPHGIVAAQVGGNVVLGGVANPAYNTNGNGVSAFVLTAVPSGSSFKIFNANAIGAGASSGGTFTTSTLPIISTFTPAYPKWTASTSYGVGDLLVPNTQPAAPIYLTCVQAGTTGMVEPSWPTGGQASVGTQIVDSGGTPSGGGSSGGIIWQVAGLLNSAAPPPPGAAHVIVYSGALWVFNTSPTDTANGLDGPTSLRQSSVGNANSWNPVNQAFLDKDDGSEGMGLAKFTITALGIPPEGSLVAFKNWTPYQIIGVFGASNLTIQAVSSNMGCISPRTITFVPGFGIARYTQLGIAIFNGVKDELVSEQIRPYLFPQNDRSFQDITVVDANWISIAWAALTATPPMYCIAAPIGNSGGQLTRIFCYDLVFKAWGVVDLPFAIGTMLQAMTLSANPVTILGGYSDGVLQRWQAGDIDWYTGGGTFQQDVQNSFRSLTIASENSDQRIYNRRLVITGTNSGAADVLTATINQSGVAQFSIQFVAPGNSDFDIDIPVQLTGKRFDAIISSSLTYEVDGCTWEVEPRPSGVVVAV